MRIKVKGAFAKEFKARCKDNNAIVAIKILKLEDASINLEDIRKEVLTMKLCNNDHVLACYSCFNVGCTLWIITPLMTKGSFLRILQYLREHNRVHEGQGFDVLVTLIAVTCRKVLLLTSFEKQLRV